MALLSPLGGYPYTITQGYGGPHGHPGIDLAAPMGTPVDAPAGGTITVPAFDVGGFGNWIIEHVQGIGDLIFGHLSAIDVHTGETVTPGEQLGNVGSTGDSTGPHLHYEWGGAGTATPLQDPSGLLPGPGNPSTVSAGSSLSALDQAILNATTDAHTQLALLVGSYLESNGTGPNPYQINLPVHPDVTAADAANPVTATNWILPAYQAAVNAIPASLWSSNPEQAAVDAAQNAEKPQFPYQQTQGQSRVDEAYQNALGVLNGGSQATLSDLHIPGTPWTIPTSPGDVANSFANGALDVIKVITAPLKMFIENVGLILLGIVIGVVGLVVLAHAATSGGGGVAPSDKDDGGEEEGEAEEGAEGGEAAGAEAAAGA